MIERFAIVGPGKLGLAIGSLVIERGLAEEVVLFGRAERAPDHPLLESDRVRYSPKLERPHGDACVILSVPDSAIQASAEELAALGEAPPGAAVLQMSGFHSTNVLEALSRRGYAVGSLHPLATVADIRAGASRLIGSFFSFEGDGDARAAADAIVGAAQGRLISLRSEDKPLYHAACVFASNYVVTCAAVAVRLLAGAARIEESDAADALRPLWEGATGNLESPGLPGALTGPIARGDAATLHGHLESLDEETGRLYRELAREALKLALATGLSAADAERVEAALARTGSRETR